MLLERKEIVGFGGLLGMSETGKMVGGTGIEPVTPCVSSKCSTPELTALFDCA